MREITPYTGTDIVGWDNGGILFEELVLLRPAETSFEAIERARAALQKTIEEWLETLPDDAVVSELPQSIQVDYNNIKIVFAEVTEIFSDHGFEFDGTGKWRRYSDGRPSSSNHYARVARRLLVEEKARAA